MVAINADAVSDGASLEIECDTYDALIHALKTIDSVCENYNPVTREYPPMPAWLVPFIVDGDPTRVVLESRDLRRLLNVSTKLRSVATALIGASVAAAIWASVSCSTACGLVEIGVTRIGMI